MERDFFRLTVMPAFRTDSLLKLYLWKAPVLNRFLAKKAAVHGAAPLIRHEASHQSMGTIFSLITYGPSSTFLEELVCQAFAEIDRLNDQMSHYKAESELSAINHQAWRKSIVVTPELFRLLEDSARYSKKSMAPST